MQNSKGTNAQTSQFKDLFKLVAANTAGPSLLFHALSKLANYPDCNLLTDSLVDVKARDKHKVGSIDRMTFQNKLSSAQEMNYLDVKGLRDLPLK